MELRIAGKHEVSSEKMIASFQRLCTPEISIAAHVAEHHCWPSILEAQTLLQKVNHDLNCVNKHRITLRDLMATFNEIHPEPSLCGYYIIYLSSHLELQCIKLMSLFI
mmetsp:Transcript_31450/g.40449  ORF Transcript_31450/g.40449 Transcript_31450/m.40449 type:complete len:108 (+) Transcript_31450:16-339(+)